jgi:hypothetical protein
MRDVMGPSFTPTRIAVTSPATHAAMLKICDGLLLELGRRSGVAGRVQEVLLEDIANRPDFETVAKRLPEQGGLGCCGARGAKGRGQGECGSAKHGPAQSREAVSQAQARIREAVTRNRQWPEKRFLVTIQGESPVR